MTVVPPGAGGSSFAGLIVPVFTQKASGAWPASQFLRCDP